MRERERKNERASEDQEEREITIAFSGCIICDWQLGLGNKDIAILGFQKKKFLQIKDTLVFHK